MEKAPARAKSFDMLAMFAEFVDRLIIIGFFARLLRCKFGATSCIWQEKGAHNRTNNNSYQW